MIDGNLSGPLGLLHVGPDRETKTGEQLGLALTLIHQVQTIRKDSQRKLERARPSVKILAEEKYIAYRRTVSRLKWFASKYVPCTVRN